MKEQGFSPIRWEQPAQVLPEANPPEISPYAGILSQGANFGEVPERDPLKHPPPSMYLPSATQDISEWGRDVCTALSLWRNPKYI